MRAYPASDYVSSNDFTWLPDWARMYLGKDLILPNELSRLGLVYTPEVMQLLGGTLRLKDVIVWSQNNDVILMPGPPRPLTLFDLREMQQDHLPHRGGNWYHDQTFSRTDRVEVGWMAVRKEPFPDSCNKTWAEQQSVIPASMQVANVAETIWATLVFDQIHRAYSPLGSITRTSSVDSTGSHVCVGVDGDGMHISLWSDTVRMPRLCLSACRKF